MLKSEIERKIQKYIERTNIPEKIYDYFNIDTQEVLALIKVSETRAVDAISDAFYYGRAKGYRAAMAEMKRKNNE